MSPLIGRLFVNFFLFILLALSPYWVIGTVIFSCFFIFPYFVEGILWGIVLDGVYALPLGAASFIFSMPFFLIFIASFVIIELSKNYLFWYE